MIIVYSRKEITSTNGIMSDHDSFYH